MKLIFAGAIDRLDEIRQLMTPFLSGEMKIQPTGKSVAVAVKVPTVESIVVPFSSVADRAAVGIQAADALVGVVQAMREQGVRLDFGV